jgi:hypothetical protein
MAVRKRSGISKAMRAVLLKDVCLSFGLSAAILTAAFFVQQA